MRLTRVRRKGLMAVEYLANDLVSPLFEAVIEATEEAILNSLTMALPMTGYNCTTGKPSSVEALPLDAIRRPS